MATATFTPLATQTLGSAAASITFSSIPGTYTDLRLVLTCTTSVSGDTVVAQFNSDTTANYSNTYLLGTGTSVFSGNNSSVTSAPIGIGATTSTTIPTLFSTDIQSYAGATNKAFLSSGSSDQNGSGNVAITIHLWRSTAAITSIKLFLAGGNNFAIGSIATIWGI